MGNRVWMCECACGCYEASDLKTLSHISMFQYGILIEYSTVDSEGLLNFILTVHFVHFVKCWSSPQCSLSEFLKNVVFNKPIEIQHINVKLRAFPLRMYLLCIQSYVSVFEFAHILCLIWDFVFLFLFRVNQLSIDTFWLSHATLWYQSFKSDGNRHKPTKEIIKL